MEFTDEQWAILKAHEDRTYVDFVRGHIEYDYPALANDPTLRERLNAAFFQPSQCLLQEAKGNYDQFNGGNGQPLEFFTDFTGMAEQIKKQGTIVRGNPPARLMWHFQTSKTRTLMLQTLQRLAVPSVCQP